MCLTVISIKHIDVFIHKLEIYRVCFLESTNLTLHPNVDLAKMDVFNN